MFTYYETLGWAGKAAGYAGIQAHPRGHNYIFSIWGHTETKEQLFSGKIDSLKIEKLLRKIDTNKLPKAYNSATHQMYVDNRIEEMNAEQRQTLGRLWKEKQRIDPNMKNRGNSFIRILEYSASIK